MPPALGQWESGNRLRLDSKRHHSRIMPNPERLTSKDLEVGGQYLHANGLFIRQIDAIDGYTVTYHDQYGLGRCGKRAFLKACLSRASAEDVAQSEEQLTRTSPTTTQDEFTLRDEANALTVFAFRNGFLEDLHSGKPSPILSEPGYSRISDEEMRRLMIEASEKLEQVLRMKREEPRRYEILIRDYQRRYCRAWNRE